MPAKAEYEHGARKLERAAADRALAYDWPFDIPYWVTIGERVTWRKPPSSP